MRLGPGPRRKRAISTPWPWSHPPALNGVDHGGFLSAWAGLKALASPLSAQPLSFSAVLGQGAFEGTFRRLRNARRGPQMAQLQA